MLELLVGGRGRDEEAALVARSEAADYSRAGDCGVADGDYVLEFGFEDTGGGELVRWCGRGWRGGKRTCRSSLMRRLRRWRMRL